MNRSEYETEVCVVGGGMAGLCAAIASARRGARTLLVQDRPVLGGNASSEVRMWICGAHGPENRETGILEEIQLENAYRNAPLNYSIWDSVLYEKAMFQPNLTTLLNTAVCDGQMDGDRLASIKGWQLTSQTWVTIHARHFIDCSGDSILAPLTGARTRWGREARAQFDEDIQPDTADRMTMGNSLLLQLRRTDEPVPFVAPAWSYRFDDPADLHHRMGSGVNGQNFWWIEIGGTQDTIADAETIRHELYRTVWGVWDYIKNRAADREKAAHWAVEWVGSLPGKRENRRYVGATTVTQHDVRAGRGHYDDVVAYGGWTMDDHHPLGLLHPGEPTVFHPAPSPYDLPWRALYSADVPNLLFAGRNISVTHAALSSTRVMATCALLGQAAGTGAALCVREGRDPADLADGPPLRRLQQQLMDDDLWLPGRRRAPGPLTQGLNFQTHGDDAALLTNGQERGDRDQQGRWSGPLGRGIELSWDQPRSVGGLRLVCDSNLRKDKRMPCSYPQPGHRTLVPNTLLKGFRVEAVDDDGRRQCVYRSDDNHQRLVKIPLQVRTRRLVVTPESTWGLDEARLFALEPTEPLDVQLPHLQSQRFQDAIADRVAAAAPTPNDASGVDPDPTPRPRRAVGTSA